MSNVRPTVLLDCDGILSDYCKACFKFIEEQDGEVHTYEQVTHWDLFNVLGKGHLKPLMKARAALPGWCSGFPVCEGAQDAVKRIQVEYGAEVVVVTSPMNTPYWADERRIWLEQHFGIPKRRVISTEGKEYVDGDVLIDDSDENCRLWSTRRGKTALLWDAPYNRDVDLLNTNVVRVKGWNDVFAFLNRECKT